MAIKITFLGTGTSQGIPIIGCSCEVCTSTNQQDKRLRTSILIEKNGKKIVIDCGPDFRQQMLRAKVSWIDAILITHEHNDHIIGLDDVRPFNFMKGRDMPIYLSQQVAEVLKQRFAYIFAKNPYPGAPMIQLNLISKSAPFQIAGIDIIPIEVMHGKLPVLGFRIDDFTYLTDVLSISEKELEKVRGTQTLVLSALHRKPHHSHLSLFEALELIQEIKPQKAYLTHLSHKMGKHEVVSKELPSNVEIAYDGLVIQ